MPQIIWDKVGARTYETGLDKGVLYLPDGSSVPWNGLTSVIEHFNKHSLPVYYDGMKVNDLVVLGEFTASMKAVTYPDEFLELEGLASSRRGLFFADQRPKTFGLCYRTQIGNDLEGDVAGYKIHIIYNVTALPREKTYASLTSDPSLVEFEWDITAVPEEFPGLYPTAHIVLDSRTFDPWLLEDIENKLYGSTSTEAVLLPMNDLITYINEWYRVKIIDNGDGTWTAIADRDGIISYLDSEDTLFQIIQVNAIYLDDNTYIISDTVDISDVPQIRIDDNGDGTWTATTEHDNIISVVNGVFTILNANVDYLSDDSYRISDTIDN